MYKQINLKNGLCLVYERVEFAKTVSTGVWVRAGSMYENTEENGISHFIEHMLFKGTSRRSASQMAEEMDYAGGQINAYTARECTCYYTKTLPESLELSLDILSDMYYNSLFNEEDIELERKVIIEEINMYEDSPEDIALDTLCEHMWSGSSIGLNVLGTLESVRKLTKEKMLDYMKRRYTPENTVISVAGSFDENMLISLCEKYFSFGQKKIPLSFPEVKWHGGRWIKKKDIEQTHLSIGYPAYNLQSNKIYSLAVINNILGGSVSGRLFQTVREKYGLCYSIYSYTGIFPQTGMIGIYAGLNSSQLERAEKVIDEEIEKVCSAPISDYELKKAQSQLKCSILMSQESMSSKMTENGKAQLLRGCIHTDEYIINIIERVSAEDIMNTAREVFFSNKAVFILEKS